MFCFFLNTGIEFLWAYWRLSGKEPTCNADGVGLIRGSGRSPGEGNANSLQYSRLGNSKDRGAWRAIVHRVTNKLDSAAERQQQTAVIPLQCRVSFCCITWVSSVYACPFPLEPPSHPLLPFHPSRYHGAPSRSLDYAAIHCQCYSPKSSHPPLPTVCTYLFSTSVSLFLPWK